jgi:nitrite reductase/ring-hydroxylating ferredoxin subunit
MERAVEGAVLATTLPPEAYAAGEPFQREKRTLFRREWLPFCAVGQLAASGSFVNHTLGGWPVMAIRGADGAMRAFHNVCRHQGMPVVDKPDGQCERLRCKFHGWTYDLAGGFVEAPIPVAPKDPESEQHHLRAVALAADAALVFVRIGEGEGAPTSLVRDGMRFAGSVVTDADCNWKTLVETLLPGEDWRYFWPIGFEATPFEGACVIRQALPRSFVRTRLVDLVFTTDGSASEAVLERIRVRAAADRQQAEARQALLVAGGDGAASDVIAAFRARVSAACGR